MTQTESRKKFIIDVAYIGLLIIAFALFLKYAFMPMLPIIIAGVIAVLLQNPLNKISAKTKIKKNVLAIIAVLLVISILGLAIFALGAKIVSEVSAFVTYVTTNIEDYNWIHSNVYTVVDKLPGFVREKVADNVDNFMAKLEIAMKNDAKGGLYKISFSAIDFSTVFDTFTSKYAMGVISTAKQIPSYILGVVICIVLSCFMTTGYDTISNGIHRMFKGGENNMVSQVKRALVSSVGKLLKAYGLICLTTFGEMLLGLTVLRLVGLFDSPYVFVIAFLAAIFDILPIVGIGFVLVPWAIFSFVNGATGLGIGLLIMYAVIAVVRQIIEPKFVAGTMELPPALTLSVMYMGLKIFGVIGMFAFVIALYCIASLEKDGVIHIFSNEEQKLDS